MEQIDAKISEKSDFENKGKSKLIKEKPFWHFGKRNLPSEGKS